MLCVLLQSTLDSIPKDKRCGGGRRATWGSGCYIYIMQSPVRSNRIRNPSPSSTLCPSLTPRIPRRLGLGRRCHADRSALCMCRGAAVYATGGLGVSAKDAQRWRRKAFSVSGGITGDSSGLDISRTGQAGYYWLRTLNVHSARYSLVWLCRTRGNCAGTLALVVVTRLLREWFRRNSGQVGQYA